LCKGCGAGFLVGGRAGGSDTATGEVQPGAGDDDMGMIVSKSDRAAE
jgi:hypothetical protein